MVIHVLPIVAQHHIKKDVLIQLYQPDAWNCADMVINRAESLYGVGRRDRRITDSRLTRKWTRKDLPAWGQMRIVADGSSHPRDANDLSTIASFHPARLHIVLRNVLRSMHGTCLYVYMYVYGVKSVLT